MSSIAGAIINNSTTTAALFSMQRRSATLGRFHWQCRCTMPAARRRSSNGSSLLSLPPRRTSGPPPPPAELDWRCHLMHWSTCRQQQRLSPVYGPCYLQVLMPSLARYDSKFMLLSFDPPHGIANLWHPYYLSMQRRAALSRLLCLCRKFLRLGMYALVFSSAQ